MIGPHEAYDDALRIAAVVHAGQTLVEAVTSRSGDDGDDASRRRARRQQQLDHLRGARDDVIRLKAADTWANVTEMTREVEARGVSGARLKAPVDELLWYYGEIAAIVRGRLSSDDVLAVPLAGAFEGLRGVVGAATRGDADARGAGAGE